MHNINYGDALNMAPLPYNGKLWLSVADFMQLEGVGEQKAYDLLSDESIKRKYYVERCGRQYRINAAQYWWWYFVGCLNEAADNAVA